MWIILIGIESANVHQLDSVKPRDLGLEEAE